MKRTAVYGVGTGINGRDAAMQATQRALDQIGTAKPVLALAFVSQEYNTTEVLAGLTSLLGDTPLWGFSTIHPMCCQGDQMRSVLIALIAAPANAASEYKADVQWFPNFAINSVSTARQFIQNLKQEVFLPQDILLAADGINGSLMPFCGAFDDLAVNVTGCMAAGEPSLGKTYIIGKNQAGPGAMSAAILGGKFRLGVGLAHGWQDLGVYFQATRTRDVWLQTLDGAPAVEAYARYFGFSPRDWAFPPLTDMARLYPLGVEQVVEREATGTGPLTKTDPSKLLLRSALRVEVDGSLRMSAPVPEGAVVHLMTGDPDACLTAARDAAEKAMNNLGGAKPLLAIALVDVAWRLLFESRPGQVSAAIKTVIGDLPLVGAYTFGQMVRADVTKPPVLHNQNLALVIIGEA